MTAPQGWRLEFSSLTLSRGYLEQEVVRGIVLSKSGRQTAPAVGAKVTGHAAWALSVCPMFTGRLPGGSTQPSFSEMQTRPL